MARCGSSGVRVRRSEVRFTRGVLARPLCENVRVAGKGPAVLPLIWNVAGWGRIPRGRVGREGRCGRRLPFAQGLVQLIRHEHLSPVHVLTLAGHRVRVSDQSVMAPSHQAHAARVRMLSVAGKVDRQGAV